MCFLCVLELTEGADIHLVALHFWIFNASDVVFTLSTPGGIEHMSSESTLQSRLLTRSVNYNEDTKPPTRTLACSHTHRFTECSTELFHFDSRSAPNPFPQHDKQDEFHCHISENDISKMILLNSCKLSFQWHEEDRRKLVEGLTSNCCVKYEQGWKCRLLDVEAAHLLHLCEWFRFIVEAWTPPRNTLIYLAITL